ncbi:hypothetical protein [Rhizobium sp. C1]|uniref:hypothetical protein n=1 Tax=Rhizobium sp. C1 TaxID=1349799 RepID=UPI001E4B23E4|nr:hypothetical protein [Rhizobium sp. C1]MCD2179045.1 hypothetical protein [Rhizobium sp. C1]
MLEAAPADTRITNVLGRLELIIDNENTRLGADPDFDIKTSNAQKSRCLYELTMLFRDTRPELVPSSFATQMQVLKTKLNANARKVQAHMEAVRAVAELLKGAARDAENDGTYQQEHFQYSEF